LIGLIAAGSAEAQTPRRSSDITINRGSFAVAPFGGYLLSQRFLDGPLGSSLGVQSTPIYGVQASLPLMPNGSLVGTIAHGSSDLEAGLPIIGGIAVGTTNTTVFDASVELRLPGNASRFVPVLQLGGGAIRREVMVQGLTAKTTDFTVSGGLGADFPISRSLAVRLMARDHYGKADFGSIGDLEASTDDLHAVTLTGGVRIAF
jgi:hypothetical protein